jgi:PAS domain S-box-containing protein
MLYDNKIATPSPEDDLSVTEIIQFYQTLADLSPIGLFRLDRKGYFNYVNQYFCQLYGLTFDQFIGKNALEFIYPDDQERMPGEWEQLFVENRPFQREYRILRSDGTVTWLVGRLVQILDNYGGIAGIVGTVNDISEFKSSQLALKKSQAEVLAVLENTTANIWSVDRNFRLLTFNSLFSQNFYQAFGVKLEVGMNLLETLSQTEQAFWLPLHEYTLSGEKFTVEYQHQSDHTTRYYEISFNPIFSSEEDNQVSGVSVFSTDITGWKEAELERRRIEDTLRENEARFRTLVSNLQVGVLLQGPGAEILVSNQLALDLLGLTEEQLLGKTSFDPDWNVIHEDGSPFPGETHPVPVALSTRQAVRDVVMGVYRPGKGDRVWLLVTALPELDPDGAVRQVICTFTDITRLKLAEEALRQSEARLQAILDNAPMPIFAKDREGRYLIFNRQCERINHLSRHEVLGKTDADFVPPEMARQWWEHDQEVLEKRQALEWEEKTGISGRERLEITTKFPLLDEKGTPYAVVGITNDITERKRAEEALVAEKERLAVTLQSIAEGVITTDKEGRVTMLNRVAEELTGWSETEAQGQPLASLFKLLHYQNGQEETGLVERLLKLEGVVDLATPYAVLRPERKKVEPASKEDAGQSQSGRFITGSSAPLRDSSGKPVGIVLVFQDVTEKQKAEEERLKAGKLEALGILAGGIAHDFNNILTAILGNISLARLYSDKSDFTMQGAEVALHSHTVASSEFESSLEEAENACLRARDLAQQLLTFARGGAPVKKTASLAELIQSSARFVLHGTAVEAEFDLPKELWPVEVDSTQLSQVVQNLIINAVQAMPGGGRLKVKAENQWLNAREGTKGRPETAGYVRFSVQDWGVGVAPEHLPKIFDPYYTTKRDGSGLGLAICYSIIKRHEGWIEVSSTPGLGTTFYVYLPAISNGKPVDTRINNKKDEKNSPHLGQFVEKERVLVMDDEVAIQKLLRQLLGRMGYDVEVASDGVAALACYQKAQAEGRSFGVVIMDLTIPGGMGGKETIRKLLEFDNTARVIVSSGYANDHAMANYQEYGFKGLVSKPYRLKELVKVVETVLAAS